jgi:hypothetical protein
MEEHVHEIAKAHVDNPLDVLRLPQEDSPATTDQRLGA